MAMLSKKHGDVKASEVRVTVPVTKDQTHIRMQIVTTVDRPLLVGGGFGQSFGAHVDEMLRGAIAAGDRVSTLTVNISLEDWKSMVDADAKEDDIAVRDDVD